MHYLFIAFLLTCSQLIFAQADSIQQPIRTYLQFSGKVVQFENGEPIEGVRVTNLTRGTIAISNKKGMFTIVVDPADKVQLSHIGMAHKYFDVPERSGSKFYREFTLDIDPEIIEAVIIGGLPPLDELGDRLMALDIDTDPGRQLALDNPDIFNILDTIIAHEPSLLAFRNGKVESSPISWFYEKVYKKIKEKLPKPGRKAVLPEFKKEENQPSN